jgi:hypothetical protein
MNDTLILSVENTEIEESVNIFPNPFRDQLNIIINSKSNRTIHITLTNLTGRQVLSVNKELIEGENQISLNTYQLSPALYILNIHGANFLKAYPLIKLKQ